MSFPISTHQKFSNSQKLGISQSFPFPPPGYNMPPQHPMNSLVQTTMKPHTCSTSTTSSAWKTLCTNNEVPSLTRRNMEHTTMVCSSSMDPTTLEPTNILDYTTCSKDTITLDLTSSLKNMNQVNDSKFPVDTSTSPIRLKLQSLTATSMDPNLLKTTNSQS